MSREYKKGDLLVSLLSQPDLLKIGFPENNESVPNMSPCIDAPPEEIMPGVDRMPDFSPALIEALEEILNRSIFRMNIKLQRMRDFPLEN